jgi:3-hydroxyacyl-[acyl-carrier-protein] dehydratase
MDIHQVLKKLPHRYPFLLVDRVLEVEKGRCIRALKNVTINEPFFSGHFPHRPVMPGVLMLEALAQAAAAAVLRDRWCQTPDENTGLLLRRHRRRALQAPRGAGRPAHPRGDAAARRRRGIYKYAARATVGGELAVEAELTCTARSVA